MGCSTTVVKYLVFFFNLIFALAGLALLAVGVLLKIKNNDVESFIPDKYHLSLPPILLIAIGAFIFVTAFFGCCGAIRESTCMLTTFAIILLTLLIIQVAIGVYAFIQKDESDDLKSSVRQLVQDAFNQYNNSNTAQEELNFLQSYMECCGVDGPTDYRWAEGKLPQSCCEHQKGRCSLSADDKYVNGCAKAAYKWFKNGLDLLGILAISVAVIEIVGAIFALCLASSIRNQIRRGAYA